MLYKIGHRISPGVNLLFIQHKQSIVSVLLHKRSIVESSGNSLCSYLLWGHQNFVYAENLLKSRNFLLFIEVDNISGQVNFSAFMWEIIFQRFWPIFGQIIFQHLRGKILTHLSKRLKIYFTFNKIFWCLLWNSERYSLLCLFKMCNRHNRK